MSSATRFAGLILLSSLILSACASIQPGRSVGRELDDVNASLDIKSELMRAEGYDLGRVDVEVTEGVALLTGETYRHDDRLYAECVAWLAPSVRSVINEIGVGEWRRRGQRTQDALISQRVRSRLLQDRSVRSLNYNIETRRGVVYLLGFARTTDEQARAAAHAALVRGVDQVVDLTRVYNSKQDLPVRGEFQANTCGELDLVFAQDTKRAPEHYTPDSAVPEKVQEAALPPK